MTVSGHFDCLLLRDGRIDGRIRCVHAGYNGQSGVAEIAEAGDVQVWSKGVMDKTKAVSR